MFGFERIGKGTGIIGDLNNIVPEKQTSSLGDRGTRGGSIAQTSSKYWR